MSKFTGFSNVQVKIAASTDTFTKVVAGTGLQLLTGTTAITYTTSDTSGATDSVVVGLNGTAVSAANGGGTAGFTTTALTLSDANSIGIGNVTINSDASVFQGLHTLVTLTDSALSNLAITGTGSLTITNAATTSTTLTISDNGAGTSATADGIGTLTSTGAILGSLSYSGTHAFTIGTLTDSGPANVTITNANTGTSGVLTISAFSDANATAVTLNGSVALSAGTFGVATAASLSAGTDNQIIKVLATGGGVKTFTVGNGADAIQTGAGADVLTFGTGADFVFAGTGADKVTFGAHTGVDKAVWLTAAAAGGGNSGTFAVPGANSISTSTFDTYTGLKAGDTLNVGTTTVTFLTAQIPGTYATAGAAASTVLNSTIAAAVGDVSTAVLLDNSITLVRGNYTSGTNTFVGSSSGSDTLFVLDTASNNLAQAYEAIVLVGYVNTGTMAVAAGGVITL